MKKFLTLVLALVLVFGLSVPAMAFTTDDSDAEKVPYDLSIYLVEYDSDSFVGLAGLPSADRGYAKNEIVAAVVELVVPKNEDVADDGYELLQFSGEHVSLNVTDNKITDVADPNPDTAVLATSKGNANFTFADNKLSQALSTAGTNYAPTSKTTYKWLFFAKVTDDEASLSAKLIEGVGADGFGTDGVLDIALDGTDYQITANTPASPLDYSYDIDFTYSGTARTITIVTNRSWKAKGMSIDLDGAGTTYDPIALGVNTDGELGIVEGSVHKTSGTHYNDVMDIYEDVVVDVFGMDYFNINNYVRKSYFENLVSAKTIIATVDIEPWTAYVSVPDNIVVDPPKTGDAASIMGFVMVALSGAGAVALKKRG